MPPSQRHYRASLLLRPSSNQELPGSFETQPLQLFDWLLFIFSIQFKSCLLIEVFPKYTQVPRNPTIISIISVIILVISYIFFLPTRGFPSRLLRARTTAVHFLLPRLAHCLDRKTASLDFLHQCEIIVASRAISPFSLSSAVNLWTEGIQYQQRGQCGEEAQEWDTRCLCPLSPEHTFFVKKQEMFEQIYSTVLK